MTTILVTGGLGVIGSRMVPLLREHGNDVKVLDNRILRLRDYIRADICSMVETERAFKEWQVDYVFHLAGEVGRENGELFARRAVDINVSGTLNLIQLCREYGSRLIYASTSEAYGDVGETVMHENLVPGKLTNCYALSKFQAEQYIRHFVENYDLQAHIFRIFMCYGPGEYPSYYRSAISRFVYNAIHDRPIYVHQSTVRSWCYVDDIVEGWQAVTQHFKPGIPELYNLGRHDPLPMAEVARLVCELSGKSEDLIRYIEMPKFVTRTKLASFEKARQHLEFESKVPLEVGLERTIEWQRQTVRDNDIEC
jgi:nucleoside-diphosphate-sugar epimerase